ncbi:hypothetical protein [Aureibaculum luteum]|uniref:hypothetical protein n=1 Tax=Aureibaculum luteum TaxID=1548456 RepID=UPI000E4AA132|nr:hypothetical protein [Aureibaculum luteum]
MNKRKQDYTNVKLISFFVVVICFILPYSTTAQNQDKSSLPTITSFMVTNKTKGDENGRKTNWIEFSWKTTNANRVKLYRDGLEIKSRSERSNSEIGWPSFMKRSFKIQHRKSAIYELVAENDYGKVTEKLDVKFKKKKNTQTDTEPEILDFKVEPTRIKSGDQVRFYWKVKNAYKAHLYDSFGEITSRIKFPTGNFGWPLTMDGEYSEHLNKSETYKLVVTGKNGTVAKSVSVYVEDKKCKLVVSVTGIYDKHTDGIGIYKVNSNGVNTFLFKSSVNELNKQGQLSYWSTIALPTGNYFLAPYGGGKDKNGNFGVIYNPRSIDYTCKDGNTQYVTIKADVAEY